MTYHCLHEKNTGEFITIIKGDKADIDELYKDKPNYLLIPLSFIHEGYEKTEAKVNKDCPPCKLYKIGSSYCFAESKEKAIISLKHYYILNLKIPKEYVANHFDECDVVSCIRYHEEIHLI